MAMLDRYKKKNGFVQLLTLIETSSKQKQEQFLTLIKQENPAWEEALKSKVLTVERILTWPRNIRAELFSRVQNLTLAVAFHSQSPEKFEEIFSCLSNTDIRKLQLMMSELNPSVNDTTSCLIKLIGEVRGLINQGIIKLDKFDPDMAISENIEEEIHKMGKEKTKELTEALVFPETDSGPTSGPTSIHAEVVSAIDDGQKEKMDFLKKKINQLMYDNSQLKNELQIYKNKLEQIRKIA